VRHAGRVAADDVEVGAGAHAGLGVPLNLEEIADFKIISYKTNFYN
jgi:hypothetical protein